MIELTPRLIGAAVLVAAFIGMLIYANTLKDTIEAREKTITGLNTTVSGLEAQNAGLSAALKQTEDNLETARKEAREQNAQYRRTLDAANKRADTYQRAAQSILRAAPKPGENRCDAAARILRENLR